MVENKKGLEHVKKPAPIIPRTLLQGRPNVNVCDLYDYKQQQQRQQYTTMTTFTSPDENSAHKLHYSTNNALQISAKNAVYGTERVT